MNLSQKTWFYFSLIAFPLFFWLHGINEQFGLLRPSVIVTLLVYYLAVAFAVGLVSRFLFRNEEQATLFAFILLCVFFFFGAVKDFFRDTSVLSFASVYRVFLPLILIFLIACYLFVKRGTLKPVRVSLFIRTLLSVCLLIELGTLVFNIATGKERQRDLGDINNTLARQLPKSDAADKPFIFWIVLDEYSGSTGLAKGWNFTNPIVKDLRDREFFVADSARSPYNYTHYSLLSTLDMQYLRSLKEHSEIGFRDIVRGNISLKNTNVVTYLRQQGYKIVNHTIYNVDEHATEAKEYFLNADFRLVDDQTLAGRIKRDLGWNMRNIFSGNRSLADSLEKAGALAKEARYRLELVNRGLEAAKKSFADGTPTFFMFHYFFTHEPFIYNADGSIDRSVGFGMYPDKYVPSVNYANRVITNLIDSLKEAGNGKNMVIVIQGDHGYKFEENDPLFDQEGCSILYAVYCSDRSYPGWSNTFNSVNGFRVLFNKYFHTNLPILENRSVNLYYR